MIEDHPDIVQVRWITATAAITYGRLGEIQDRLESINTSLSLKQLKPLAERRFLSPSGSSSAECYQSQVQLLLPYFQLCCDGSDATVADLGIQRKETLNIFVVLSRHLKKENSGEANNGDSASKLVLQNQAVPRIWPFETTERGAATFIMSLKAVIHSIKSGRNKLDNLLSSLWEATHFPPAVLAFAELCDNHRSDPAASAALSILAQTFRSLCLKVVPLWISERPAAGRREYRRAFG